MTATSEIKIKFETMRPVPVSVCLLFCILLDFILLRVFTIKSFQSKSLGFIFNILTVGREKLKVERCEGEAKLGKEKMLNLDGKKS